MSQGIVQVGHPAPPFSTTAVVDGRFKNVSLSSYTEANHWVVLVFYPKAWSFICPTEIKAFSTRLEEFLYSRSCAVVFVSTDTEYCLKAWNATSDMEGGLGGVHVPLASDCNQKICRDYGVLIEEEGTAQRALFIIDPKSIVRSITVNDADVGRSVDETLRVLDALVFKDEFGAGCPVDWKKGDQGVDTKIQIDGNHELKKSWSEWARPKLNRAWSAASHASQRSISSNNIVTLTQLNQNRLRAESNSTDRLTPTYTNGTNSPHRPTLSSGRQSPMVSPLLSPMSMPSNSNMQAQLDRATMQQRMDNMQATMQNQEQAQSIGMAS